jgi:hypothetical protein
MCNPQKGVTEHGMPKNGVCSTDNGGVPQKGSRQQYGFCIGHRDKNVDSYVFDKPTSGGVIVVDQVNTLKSAIEQEMARRNLHKWPLSDSFNGNTEREEKLSSRGDLNPTAKGDVVVGNPVAKLEEIVNEMHRIDDETSDFNKGKKTLAESIANMQNEVSLAMSDCICYSDCVAYYRCNCYGYCNNY